MDDLAQLTNASATYDEVAATGPPSSPLTFPDPTLNKAARVSALVFNPQTGEEMRCDNVIYRLGGGGSGGGGGGARHYNGTSGRAAAGRHYVGSGVGRGRGRGPAGVSAAASEDSKKPATTRASRTSPPASSGSGGAAAKGRGGGSSSGSSSGGGGRTTTKSRSQVDTAAPSEEEAPDGPPSPLADEPELPEHAYWIGRKLKKAIYGCVRACTVLRRRRPKKSSPGRRSRSGGSGDGRNGPAPITATWEITTTMAAVKIIDWNAVRALRGRHTEDPVKEVACMQYISKDGREPHPNVLGTWDVLADDQYMYSFMPFCTGGEMFTYVERDGRMPEPLARFWFRQILQGLYHLQKMGVCHRDLSLENLLVDENTKCLVIDMGMCLRVPFNLEDGDESTEVTDVSANTLRRLITPQGQCGKPNYISPEVLMNVDPFDPFAIDLWAAGVILFVMLVGLPPFDFASDQDPRFRMITRGGLVAMLNQWQRGIGTDAGDLLQKMLRKDPRDRLSLIEVMDHHWVMDDNVTPPPPVVDEGWRT